MPHRAPRKKKTSSQENAGGTAPMPGGKPGPASKFMGAGGQDRSAVRAHAMNRSHTHHKSDNSAKV